MNEKYLWELWFKCKHPHPEYGGGDMVWPMEFAELIVRECINKIETYHIPVGNSAAGEMACGMTYSALKEIRDEIKELFRVEYPSVT